MPPVIFSLRKKRPNYPYVEAQRSALRSAIETEEVLTEKNWLLEKIGLQK